MKWEFLKDKKYWASEVGLNSGFQKKVEASKRNADFWVASTGSSARNRHSQKWVGISETAFTHAISSQVSYLEIVSDDRFLNVLPPSHIAFVSAKARMEYSGGEFIDLLKPSFKWDPEAFVEAFKRESISLSSLVPAQVFDLLELGVKAPLKDHRILVGGGALSPLHIDRARALGWMLLPSYGATETCAVSAGCSRQSWLSSDYSLRPLDHVSFKLFEDRKLGVSSKALFDVYAYFNEEQGELSFEEPEVKEGFWVSEDTAKLSDGVLEIEGRGNRFAKILGENVSLEKIEAKVLESTGFVVTVLARAHDRRGYDLVAVTDHAFARQAKKALLEYNQTCPGVERLSYLWATNVPKAENHKTLYGELQSRLEKEGVNSEFFERL